MWAQDVLVWRQDGAAEHLRLELTNIMLFSSSFEVGLDVYVNC